MAKKRNSDKADNGYRNLPLNMGTMPFIEMTGNRSIVIEGSTGILLYENDNIKINTQRMVISFCGRSLTVKCITCSCVEISGFITKVEFIA